MPGLIRVCTPWQTTGRQRHRKSFFGKMILQVEEISKLGSCGHLSVKDTQWNRGEKRLWRDATWEEVQHG